MRSLIGGIVMIVGGLSGSLVLRGTGSSGALVLLGIVVLIIGFVRLSGGGGEQGMTPSADDLQRDQEQWEDYQRSKVKLARQQQLKELLARTPGAKQTVDELMDKTAGHLSGEEQLALALQTASRLNAEHNASAT
jgi:hypothetical protein